MPKSKNIKSELVKLQQDFASHIFDKDDQKIIDELPYSKQEALARLNIYRNNVIGNFEGVLASTFEVVKKIVGEKYFEKLVETYAVKHPSQSGNLDFYGQYFPAFIKKKLKEHKLLYLEDVAKLEWLYHQSYFEKDAKALFDVEKFKKIAPEKYKDLSFKLHPTSLLFSSKFPVFTIWKNNIEDKKKRIKIADNAEMILIERVGGKSMITKLTEEEFIFLSLIGDRKKLYETYQKICRKTKKEVAKKEIDIGNFLNRFISSGVFVDFKITK